MWFSILWSPQDAELTHHDNIRQWCKELGFDMDNHDRADAMWTADNWSVVTTVLPPDLTHPCSL
jgi:hypothetical protein